MQLVRWRDELAAKTTAPLFERPTGDELSGLRRKLAEAVRDERFEEAAQLRDAIRRKSQEVE